MTESRAPRTRLVDRLSRLESSGVLQDAAYRAYLALDHGAARLGLHVVRASYDSPIPVDPTDASFDRESPMRGIEWDPLGQIAWVEAQLAPYLAEFRPAPDPGAPPGRFRLDNRTYDRVDAELLYAILRWARPARYVELGSGYSTLVAAEALAANAAGGREAKLECDDPFPSPHVRGSGRPRGARSRGVGSGTARGRGERACGRGRAVRRHLAHGQVGGDVNRIVLDLLPLAAPGVLVHFHDVFLPAEYSRGVRGAHYWNEQYLIQAFLSGNRGWEVMVGAQAIVRAAPQRVGSLIDSYHDGVSPGALWIRRRGPEAS